MLDKTTPNNALLSRALHCNAAHLAAIPHEFRGVSAWLNFNCAMIGQCDDPADVVRLQEDLKLARTALDKVLPYFSLTSDLPKYHPAAVEWFRQCLRACPLEGAPFLRVGDMLHEVQDAAEASAQAAGDHAAHLALYH